MPTKDDWIAAGLDALAEGGEGAIRVDRLAAQLGVTKGSFHHHFRGAAALRAEVLESFRQSREELAKDIGRGVDDMSADEALEYLATLIARVPDDRLDRAVRSWALVDEQARAAQDDIDAQQLAALEAIWRRIVPGEHARTAALIPFLALVGASATTAVDREDIEAVLRMLAQEAHHVPNIIARL
ncbi:MAG TPA: TetR/AcrR family transcriptional regulator [Candidatus Agrococcus pullicola]|uniref:TetR/AcrR family transcriptional regulator n=1 Tax=Candidatus Agrococcus pullicola TaxID=2838429 RepID=A0A9D2C9P8_9MICO|nr:TetR/AcrR family transcriptional regulator [Candidatus Agrococcus pullicola]